MYSDDSVRMLISFKLLFHRHFKAYIVIYPNITYLQDKIQLISAKNLVGKSCQVFSYSIQASQKLKKLQGVT